MGWHQQQRVLRSNHGQECVEAECTINCSLYNRLRIMKGDDTEKWCTLTLHIYQEEGDRGDIYLVINQEE